MSSKNQSILDNLKGQVLPVVFTYATYDSTWKQNSESPVSQVMSVSATPGSSWVSLSWIPPSGGLNLLNYECGYVICRSATSAPQTLADVGATIVYVGTGNHIGDMPLSINTAELRTADMGLLQKQVYYYSVFVVTTIDPKTQLGYISAPMSIAVATTGLQVEVPASQTAGSYIPNLVQNPAFTGAKGATIPNWSLTDSTLSFSLVESGGGDQFNPNADGYLSVTMPTLPPCVTCSSCHDGTTDTTCQKCVDCPSCTSPILYQVITPNPGKSLVPGTLYSFSVWFRTNNPLYFPTIQIWGNNTYQYDPWTNQDTDPCLGFFQEDQGIDNEGPLGTTTSAGAPCSYDDSINCVRTLDLGTGAIYYAYSNPNWTGVWQRVSMSVVIGSTEASPLKNAYNAKNPYGGDSVQSPFLNDQATKIEASDFEAFTISFQFGCNALGTNIGGIIDIADVMVVEGLIPYSDPFWSVPTTNNLVYNPNFDGLYVTYDSIVKGVSTPIVECAIPFWMFDSSTNPDAGVCEGATLCFSESINPKYNGSVPTQCGPYENIKPLNNIESYVVMSACGETAMLTQGNIYGSTPNMFSSFMLGVTSYTLTFQYAILSTSQNSDVALTINIGDYTKAPEVSVPYTLTGTPGAFYSATVSFDCPSKLNPQIQFSVLSNIPTVLSSSIAIANVTLAPTGKESYGIQSPYPAIATVPYTTVADLDKHAIVWTFPEKSSKSVANQLFNETAQRIDGTPLDSSQGMTLLTAYHETCVGLPPGQNFDNNGNQLEAGVDIVSDSDPDLANIVGSETAPVLAITKANVTMLNGKQFSANASAFLQSNAYYGSGRWDIWVKLASLKTLDGNIYSGPKSSANLKPVYNPTSTCMAMWIFHALDYGIAGGAPALLYTQTLLNSEIDIEIGGACPDYSQNYGYNVARLNGWGGQWGCSGNCTNNFTMHTQMPASLKSPQGVNVDDGYYHKLSIVYHSGTDFTPNALDPNGTYPDTREPGFIKWFVDDVEWGGGWTGNTYGFDYVPITATRLVFGPEATDWAGCCLCATTSGLCNGCADNQALQGRCYALCGTPSDITNPVEPSECVYGTCVPSTAVSTSANAAAYEAFGEAFSGSGYAPPCNEWSTATLNIAKIQFTPTCLDCTLPTNPAYISDATLPARPDATKGKLLGPSNRNRCLPETKPYQVFPVT